MDFGLFNITTATTTTLIAKGQKAGSVKSIRIANVHNTNSILLDLYLDDNTNQTYFFKKNYLAAGEVMFLDKGVNFNNSALGLKMTPSKFANSTGINVNVIIK